MEHQRAQSFSHPPRQTQLHPDTGAHYTQDDQQQYQHQYQEQQMHENVQQPSRGSPFVSSGPVAMMNHIRPGVPGQFPGAAVRTNTMTQLSTPMIPTRRPSNPLPVALSSSISSPNTSSTLPTSRNPFQYSTTSSQQLPLQPPLQSPFHIDPSQESNQVPNFQLQSAGQPVGDLFSRDPNSFNPSNQNQSQIYDGLFGTPSMDTTISAPSSSFRTTQSFAYGQTAQSVPSSYDDQPTPRNSAPQPYAPAPPPAAPFLGYADSNRPQSISRSSASTTQLSSAVPPPPVLSPSRLIHNQVRTADDLLAEFMRVSLEDEYFIGLKSPMNAENSTFPGSTGNMVPPTKKRTFADIPDTIGSLEELYQEKKWKTLTKKALSMLQSQTNDTTRTLEIKSWWLAGLIKEGHYDNATSVFDQIGNLDSVEDGKNSFVTIRLRLLEAMLSKYKGNVLDHEKKLFQLITNVKSQLNKNPRVSTWLRIVQFTLVNHLIQQNKFGLAIRVCASIQTNDLQEYEFILVVSRLGRIHLQMGDLINAEIYFTLARSHAENAMSRLGNEPTNSTSRDMSSQLQGRLLLNDGLLFFAQNKLQEALSAFDSILHLETTRVDGHPFETSIDEQLFLEEDLICVAVNNYAIAALYCCDVKGAVAALERMIRSNPARFLNAVVVFNLSSLYDLVFDNATSTSRKEMMKKVAELYDLEHIDQVAFRI